MNDATRGPRYRVEEGAKRVRVFLGGEVVADTIHPRLVWEVPYYPAYYFPARDVRTELLVPTGHTTHSPSRGHARHFTVKAGAEAAVDAAWQYPDSPVSELRDLIRFEWEAMGGWFEEDEEVYTHPRDPYTRVDISRARVMCKWRSTASRSPTPTMPTSCSRPACPALVPPEGRYPHGSARRNADGVALPVQGAGAILVGSDRRPTRR